VDAEDRSGLRGSLSRLGATLISVVHTRLEIVSLEYEEEREWLRMSLLVTTLALLLVGVGVLLGLAFVILVVPEGHRAMVTGVLALAFLGAGVVLALHQRARMRQRPRLFETTLAELAKDRDQFLGRR
jgi:uncharacterized membrane protein YqjE